MMKTTMGIGQTIEELRKKLRETLEKEEEEKLINRKV